MPRPHHEVCYRELDDFVKEGRNGRECCHWNLLPESRELVSQREPHAQDTRGSLVEREKYNFVKIELSPQGDHDFSGFERSEKTEIVTHIKLIVFFC